jgi:hypothetical protein
MRDRREDATYSGVGERVVGSERSGSYGKRGEPCAGRRTRIGRKAVELPDPSDVFGKKNIGKTLKRPEWYQHWAVLYSRRCLGPVVLVLGSIFHSWIEFIRCKTEAHKRLVG